MRFAPARLLAGGNVMMVPDEHCFVAMDQRFTNNRRLFALRPCQKFIQCRTISPTCVGTREAIECQAD